MSRFRKIEFTKFIGCHHDDDGNLIGGTPIEMVAMYDSEHLTEEEARNMVQVEEENKYLMIILKCHYDNILVPAVKETSCSKVVNLLNVGDKFYYSEGMNEPTEKCKVHYIGHSTDGDIKEIGLTFFNENDEETDADIFEYAVVESLFKTLEDLTNRKSIVSL